jgi:hypothetical protein
MAKADGVECFDVKPDYHDDVRDSHAMLSVEAFN